MKVTRKIIEIDEDRCTGCGQCVVDCAEGALAIVDGKARVIAEVLCDGLGACIGACPEGALRIVEREADEFDEAAVAEHLRRRKTGAAGPAAGGCPSSRPLDLQPVPFAAPGGGSGPALAHWPVQIRLVSPEAPFLAGCDLLIAADCVPVAYAAFHRDLAAGRVVMIGCPKFDDRRAYEDKFAEILARAGLRSVTLARMSVPCCAGLRGILAAAAERSGAEVPVREVVIAPDGSVAGETAVDHGHP